MADTAKRRGPGRPPRYEEPKQRRELTLSDPAWQGLQALAAAAGLSVSEFVERLGRGSLSPEDLGY
jgi:hypothetical protein